LGVDCGICGVKVGFFVGVFMGFRGLAGGWRVMLAQFGSLEEIWFRFFSTSMEGIFFLGKLETFLIKIVVALMESVPRLTLRVAYQTVHRHVSQCSLSGIPIVSFTYIFCINYQSKLLS
jgi:hypothetical protein